MHLVKFNPTRDFLTIRRRVDSVFDDFFGDVFSRAHSGRPTGWHPKVDVFEKADQIVMKAELPGVDKDNITIDVNGRVLTVKGERSHENETTKDNYTLRECSYGKFQRSFTLPDETDSEKIKAIYKDGVLELSIPKPESVQPKKIAIQ